MNTHKIIALSVFLVVLVAVPLSHYLLPDEKIFITDIIVSLANLVLLLYLLFGKKQEKAKPYSIFLYLALGYTVLKGITLFFIPSFSGYEKSSLGIIDYTPFFIFLTTIVICYNFNRNISPKNAN